MPQTFALRGNDTTKLKVFSSVQAFSDTSECLEKERKIGCISGCIRIAKLEVKSYKMCGGYLTVENLNTLNDESSSILLSSHQSGHNSQLLRQLNTKITNLTISYVRSTFCYSSTNRTKSPYSYDILAAKGRSFFHAVATLLLASNENMMDRINLSWSKRKQKNMQNAVTRQRLQYMFRNVK